MCGSGLRAVALGMLHVASGDADVIVAGGQESMSLSPHAAHMRGGTKMGDVKFVDTMINDGLWDVFHDYHMGITAENVAQKYEISRDRSGRTRRRLAEQGGSGPDIRPASRTRSCR